MASEILSRANEFVGVRYQLHGQDPSGWDCLGCVKWLRAHLFGRSTPWGPELYTKEQARDPEQAEAMILARVGEWREVGPEPGVVILFERMGRRDHVGLLLDPNNFIHAEMGSGTVAPPLTGPWRRRVRGFYEASC